MFDHQFENWKMSSESESSEKFDECDEDYEEDTESSDEAGQIALAVDHNQLSGSEGPPQNGHDYLRLVQTERAKYPNVISTEPKQSTSLETNRDKVATKSDSINSQSISREEKDAISYLDASDIKYRDDIIENFKRLREKIDEIREFLSLDKPDDPSEGSGQQSAKQMKKNLSRSNRRANSLIKLMELGHPPQVSALVYKSQLELHLTLERLADQGEMTPRYATIHTDWIYSLMATLREPIEPDICSDLRRLARLCIKRRKMYEKAAKAGECERADLLGIKLSDSDKALSLKSGRSFKDNEELVKGVEEEEYASSLLIVCIVRHYFGQTDLK